MRGLMLPRRWLKSNVSWDVTLCILRRIFGEIYQTTRRHISEDSLHYRNYIVILFSLHYESELPNVLGIFI